MKTPLFAYRLQMGDYPSTEEGLQALIARRAARRTAGAGPTSRETSTPLDPWKEPYQYKYPGTHNKDSYDLWSKGPHGTDGADDDIGNW
jgi:general secretion pathway protein G